MPPAGRCDSQGVPRAPSASSGPRAVPRPAACPACRTRPLRRDRAALRRPSGHTYGIARCGCASLLTGRRATSGATRPWPGPGTTSWPRAATYPSARWWPGWRPPPCPIGAPWDRWRRRGPRPGSPSSAATSPNDPCLSRLEPRHGSRKEAEPEHMTAWSEPVIRCRVTRPTRRDVTRAPARSFRSCPWPR
jgi:hypothetical protein